MRDELEGEKGEEELEGEECEDEDEGEGLKNQMNSYDTKKKCVPLIGPMSSKD